MSGKKGNKTTKGRTSKKGAIKLGLRQETFTVTLDVWPEAPDGELRRWRNRGEFYARLFAHPDCPPTFRKIFGRIFVEELFNKSNLADPCEPELIRAFYPMVLADLQTSIPCNVDGIEAALLHALEATVPDELIEHLNAEVRALEGEGGAGK